MSKVHKVYDPVVGTVLFDSAGEVVHEVAVSAAVTTVDDRTDRWDFEPDVTFIREGHADTFWKGCTPVSNETRFVRSASAVEFGNRKQFCYVTGDERLKYVRFYRQDGTGNITISIRKLVMTEDAYGTVIRYRVECWDNPKSGRGKQRWVRQFDGYAEYGYDRKDFVGYTPEEQVARVVMLYGAKVLYGNV